MAAMMMMAQKFRPSGLSTATTATGSVEANEDGEEEEGRTMMMFCQVTSLH